MKATVALFRNEFRLLLRNPAVVIWTVLIPVAAIVVMCVIPGARQPLPHFGGLSVIESYQPTLVVFAATMLALQMMPMFIGHFVATMNITTRIAIMIHSIGVIVLFLPRLCAPTPVWAEKSGEGEIRRVGALPERAGPVRPGRALPGTSA